MKTESSWPFPISGTLGLSNNMEHSKYDKDVRFGYFNTHDGYVISVAYRPAVSGKNSNFIDVAVAVKVPEDQFCRATGRDLAYSRLENGNYITLPLGRYGMRYVPGVLEDMVHAL